MKTINNKIELQRLTCWVDIFYFSGIIKHIIFTVYEISKNTRKNSYNNIGYARETIYSYLDQVKTYDNKSYNFYKNISYSKLVISDNVALKYYLKKHNINNKKYKIQLENSVGTKLKLF